MADNTRRLTPNTCIKNTQAHRVFYRNLIVQFSTKCLYILIDTVQLAASLIRNCISKMKIQCTVEIVLVNVRRNHYMPWI